ncbi:hypothetical protein [uncultured Thermomonospora sp.]|uniref:hypothetical protein n=1 Tax=uncultured Thermomonospora sp. TaxID=671175 RepID=UPI00259B6737|nr:hypothetical protein [uncultured Thermomonospora sp.]
MYTPHLLDPRDVPGGLTFLRRNPALGVEVTVPALAIACQRGNIDPQHTGGDASRCAIEEAVTAPLPPAGTVLVTVRPDADALGAMAVLSLRAEGREIEGDLADRVAQIAQADKEAAGPWPGPRPIGAPEDLITAASVVNAVCMDHSTPLKNRVEGVREWLLTGRIPGQKEITSRLLREARDALDSLDVRVVDGIAVIVGSHRLAMTIGYRFAPVVVATNPAFRWQGGEPHVKHTIARWNSNIPMNWPAMLAALQAAEPGWGGSTSICGSPQGRGSKLTTQQVTEITLRHIR